MPEAFQSWKFPPKTPSSLQEKCYENLQPRLLLSPRRLDVAVKWRFFRHLLSGSDSDAEKIYRGTIAARNGARIMAGLTTDGWKSSLDNWVDASKALLASMQENGFIEQHAIPLDKNGELLNGTHRLACALAMGFASVPVWRLPDKEVWAPVWGIEWFRANGMPDAELQRLVNDFEALNSGEQIDAGGGAGS